MANGRDPSRYPIAPGINQQPERAATPEGGGTPAAPPTAPSGLPYSAYPGFNNTAYTQPPSGPTGGPFQGLNPPGAFGNPYGISQPFGPFVRTNQHDQYGAGLYGLPDAFTGWSGPARYSLGPALSFSAESQPAIDYYKGQLGKDYSKELFGLSSDVYEGQAKSGRAAQEQGLARAGYGGGGALSPFAGLQVQLETQARAGALGNAARQSVLQAQQIQAEASRSYLNAISQRLQALLTPAQLQNAGATKTPAGQIGPSYIGPALNLGASLINAAA